MFAVFFHLGHISSSWCTCYVVRGRALGIARAGQPKSLSCGAVCGGGVREVTMLLAWLVAGFQSLLPPPASKLGPSGADSQMVGFVYALGPCGSLQRALVLGWEFLPPPQPPRIFTARSFEDFFSCPGTVGCAVVSLPSCSSYHLLSCLPSPPATALPLVRSIWLPISAPPTSL